MLCMHCLICTFQVESVLMNPFIDSDISYNQVDCFKQILAAFMSAAFVYMSLLIPQMLTETKLKDILFL